MNNPTLLLLLPAAPAGTTFYCVKCDEEHPIEDFGAEDQHGEDLCMNCYENMADMAYENAKEAEWRVG